MTITFSRKAFLAAALLIVLVLSSVVLTYAEVIVGSVKLSQGTVTYSLDNAQAGAWTTTLTPSGPSDPWYSRLEINGAGYNGPVTVTWKLQQKTGCSSWTDVSGDAMSTSMVLSGSVQNVYATSDGAYGSGNYEWGHDVTASGTYRVVVTIMA
jgi:hypothetical protein